MRNRACFNCSLLLVIKRGTITQAKGSAYIELGRTKLAVSVFDPREIPKQNKYNVQGELFCDFKYSPFACRIRRPPQPDSEERSLSSALQRALFPAVCRNEFPNFQVDVFVNVLEDDGSVLAAAITAAGLALADAGIPMYDVITAASCCVLDGKLIMDPSRAEEQLCNASFCATGDQGLVTISRLSTHEQISEIWFNGYLSLKTTEKCISALVKVNEDIVPVIQDILVKKVNRFMKEKSQVQSK